MGAKKSGKPKARVFTRPKLTVNPPLQVQNAPGIHDTEPTRNVKEMHFAIHDWFKLELPKEPTSGNLADFVYSYGLEESQNFLGQVTDLVATDRGTGVTKNRIKSVTLDILSPEGPLNAAAVGNLTTKVSLPLVVSAVPVPTSVQGTAASPGPNAIIGQNSTVVHPDVRRAWLRVGHWDWATMFSDTQLQPFYSQYDSTADPSRNGIGVELFRLGVYDAVGGEILYSTSDDKIVLDFRVTINMAAPIGLTPTPLRFSGRVKNFAGEANNEVVSGERDVTPVQYSIKGVQNLF